MSRSMSFLINDASTGGTFPQVRVTINESTNGTLSFNVSQEGSVVGDLRGLFFDLANSALVGSLRTTSVNSGFEQAKDGIKDLGNGANMNGLTLSGNGFDAGIEIGTSGIGSDDIRNFEFTLSSTIRALTLEDFANVEFGVRLTSVGTLGGSRNDSSKIIEMTSTPMNAIDDVSGVVVENSSATGNLFSNDTSTAGNSNTVTGWSGGAAGTSLKLITSDADALEVGSVTVGSNGQWVVSVNGINADQLSAGEAFTRIYSVDVKSIGSEASDSSTDTSIFTVDIVGQNDGPVAEDDSAAAAENTQTTGSVLLNDSDIDRLDTINITGWTGGALGQAVAIPNAAGATVQLKADGSYVLNASAADALSAGESITQTFTYTLADNHGATDTATLQVSVTGSNDRPVAVDDVVGGISERGSIVSSVTSNDSDVDRLDTHTWTLNAGSFLDAKGDAAKGSLVFNTNGSWSYNANGAYDSLIDGESVNLSFAYAMTDNNGASSTALVRFTVNGEGSLPPVEPPKPPVGKNFPTWAQDISHFTLVFDTAAGDVVKPGNKKTGPILGDGYYTVKLDFDPKVKDLDLVIEDVVSALIAKNQFIHADTELLGVVIKGGKQITSYYAYGDNNLNGEAADTLPVLGFFLNGTHAGEQNPQNIDISYSGSIDGFIY